MSYPIAIDNKKYSFTEYLAFEDKSIDRHDFYHGELFAMAGGTKNHNVIIVNTTVALKNGKKPKCNVYIDGMRLELEKDAFYVYPDLIYTCDDDVDGNETFIKYPSIIFEVLSEGTALYDKEVKLKYYKKIPTLKYYVLVSQKEVMIEVYSRINDSKIWKYQTFETLDELIEFTDLELFLPTKVVYDGVEFEKI
jgi:Uma2 family endonuclease